MPLQDSFQLKSDFFPITVLNLNKFDLEHIRKNLRQTTAVAPHYFEQTPVIIDIAELETPKKELDVKALIEALREFEIILIGIRGLESDEQHIATDAGIAYIKSKKKTEKSLAEGNIKKESPEKIIEKAQATSTDSMQTKIITKPVRAGTQIYSKGDLIILAAVNSGAEVISEGSIHIYGSLRGKALAGGQNNTDARIFCRSLEAELICIAGRYLIKDDIAPLKTKQMLQIYLKSDKLQIEEV